MAFKAKMQYFTYLLHYSLKIVVLFLFRAFGDGIGLFWIAIKITRLWRLDVLVANLLYKYCYSLTADSRTLVLFPLLTCENHYFVFFSVLRVIFSTFS